jgi:hypothetical protein
LLTVNKGSGAIQLIYLGEDMGRTISQEVGSGPIDIITLVDDSNHLASTERVVAPAIEQDNTETLDGRRSEKIDLNLGGPDAPLANAPLPATDDGPTPAYKVARDDAVERLTAANNNEPKKEPYNLKKMYALGELGNGQPENELHWHDVERLRLELLLDSGEPINEDDWRELKLIFCEGFFGNTITTTTAPDAGLSVSDDLEFEDTNTVLEGNVVDGGSWDLYRDLPPKTAHLYATQVVALARDVLGQDFELLRRLHRIQLGHADGGGKRRLQEPSVGERLRQRDTALRSSQPLAVLRPARSP